MEYTYDEIMKDKSKFDESCKKYFDKFDKDKSGSVDLKELYDVWAMIFANLGMTMKPKEKFLNYVLKDYDKDLNGKISYNEFKTLFYDTCSTLVEMD